ncbi:hypothetical protein M0802_004620 [Mischocyttarus mexicanus]|nr:hypothetical protein M0802_004620 [Mischocyttarus mexicanus]
MDVQDEGYFCNDSSNHTAIRHASWFWGVIKESAEQYDASGLSGVRNGMRRATVEGMRSTNDICKKCDPKGLHEGGSKSGQMAPTGGNCGLLLALLAFSSWLQIAQWLWRHHASNAVRGTPKQRRKLRRQPFSLEKGALESAATATNSTTPYPVSTNSLFSATIRASSAAASSSRQPLPQIGNSRIHFPLVDRLAGTLRIVLREMSTVDGKRVLSEHDGRFLRQKLNPGETTTPGIGYRVSI